MRKLPPLNPLKAFEATARLSSVKGAAEELCVTHSSISQHISQLEAYLGQELFIRKGRGLEPTPAALTYLEELRTSFDRIALATDHLVKDNNRDTLTINATPSFAMHWLIPKATQFQAEHPDIDLVISTTTSDAIPKDALQDFIVRRERIDQPGYECVRLLDDIMTPVISAELYEKFSMTTPEKLQEATLLHMNSRPDAWPRWFSAQGVDVKKSTKGQRYDHFFLSLEAAARGQGVAIGTYALMADFLRYGRLVVPFPERTISGSGFHLLYRRESSNRNISETFLSWILNIASS